MILAVIVIVLIIWLIDVDMETKQSAKKKLEEEAEAKARAIQEKIKFLEGLDYNNSLQKCADHYFETGEALDGFYLWEICDRSKCDKNRGSNYLKYNYSCLYFHDYYSDLRDFTWRMMIR